MEILSRKLKSTLDNLGEDHSNVYQICVKPERLAERFSDYIASRAEEIIFQHYRTVFIVDIKDKLATDPVLKPHLGANEIGRIEIGGSLLKDVIRKESI